MDHFMLQNNTKCYVLWQYYYRVQCMVYNFTLHLTLSTDCKIWLHKPDIIISFFNKQTRKYMHLIESSVWNEIVKSLTSRVCTRSLLGLSFNRGKLSLTEHRPPRPSYTHSPAHLHTIKPYVLILVLHYR